MPTFLPIASTSIKTAVTTSSTPVAGLTMTAAQIGPFWILTTDATIYWAQGTTPTATVGNGSNLLPAGQSVTIDGANGPNIALIAPTGTANASVARAKVFR